MNFKFKPGQICKADINANLRWYSESKDWAIGKDQGIVMILSTLPLDNGEGDSWPAYYVAVIAGDFNDHRQDEGLLVLNEQDIIRRMEPNELPAEIMGISGVVVNVR